MIDAKQKVGDKVEAKTEVDGAKKERAPRTPKNVKYRVLEGVDAAKVHDGEFRLTANQNLVIARIAPDKRLLIEQMLATTKAMPAYKTSMALDYENGRPMEIEAILGNTVRAGRKVGVATPNLDAIYALAKMVAGAGRASARL